MFDLRKFWLGTAVYVLIIGVVIATVCAAFNAFIGMPAKQQVVTHTAPIQAWDGKGVPVEIEREVAAPGALPVSPLAHRTPATNIAATMTPPQTIVHGPQIIVPERKSTRRGGSLGLGF